MSADAKICDGCGGCCAVAVDACPHCGGVSFVAPPGSPVEDPDATQSLTAPEEATQSWTVGPRHLWALGVAGGLALLFLAGAAGFWIGRATVPSPLPESPPLSAAAPSRGPVTLPPPLDVSTPATAEPVQVPSVFVRRRKPPRPEPAGIPPSSVVQPSTGAGVAVAVPSDPVRAPQPTQASIPASLPERDDLALIMLTNETPSTARARFEPGGQVVVVAANAVVQVHVSPGGYTVWCSGSEGDAAAGFRAERGSRHRLQFRIEEGQFTVAIGPKSSTGGVPGPPDGE